MKTFDTLTEAIQDLKSRGYAHDFNLQSEWLECISLNIKLGPSDFHVDEIYRFEGMNDPDDSSILFAIRSAAGVKGILVDAYGAYSSALSAAMLTKLTIDSKTKH